MSPTSEHVKFMSIMHKSHEAYGLIDKKKSKDKELIRARPWGYKMTDLLERKTYYRAWQQETEDRLSGNKRTGCGKYGTPASKTMYNCSMSYDSKRKLKHFLESNGIDHQKISFFSTTTMMLEGMFGDLNSSGVIPSALEYKYKVSRLAYAQAMRATQKLGNRRYDVDTDCVQVVETKKRKDMKSNYVGERIQKESQEMRQFARQHCRGVVTMGVRQLRKARPGTRPVLCRKSHASP